MSEPRKLYDFVFVYNPSKNVVTDMDIFNGDMDGFDEYLKYLSKNINVMEEIILGKSIGGNYYQLYIERYRGGSQYVREDVASVNKYMDTSRIGYAVNSYMNEHNLWKRLKEY